MGILLTNTTNITDRKESVTIMKIKITVYNNKNTLTVQVENTVRADIGKEVQECITNFNKYYGEMKYVEVDVL